MDNINSILKFRDLEEGILEIKLNRPGSLNALNSNVLKFLYEKLLEIKNNKKIKAIILTGEGKAFSAGADVQQLQELKGQSGIEFAKSGQKVFNLLEQLGKPSLSAINGYALGGGLELSMATTIRIASSNAIFGQPEIKLGVIPAFGGTQRLARLIGKGRALDICLTGRTIKSEEALSFGLITEITFLDDLLDRAVQTLKNIISYSSLAQTSIISTIDNGYNLSLQEGMELEAAYFGLCCATKDKNEGVNAFLEKRVAVFTGE
ncbi:enoyl-CoA hydratase-related protein [Gammaproteobacteria bacterium]|nr:enoyl-CoA hydratase-related protein [Gammaproteobacteria bacterium]